MHTPVKYWLKHLTVLIVLLGLILAPSWSLFAPSMFRVHDYVHGARISEILYGLKAGHIPVRWSAHFGYGYGMPLYIFYAPLPYYFGAFIYWLSGNLIFAVKSLFLFAQAGSVIGGYLLGKRITKTQIGGLVVATLIGLAPYRALNLYVRGAISESWGILFIPWLWYGLAGLLESVSLSVKKTYSTLVTRIFTNGFTNVLTTNWFIVVCAALGILLSHNLTTLMSFPITALFVLIWLIFNGLQQFSQKKLDIQSISTILESIVTKLVTIGSAFILAIGLGSFYVIPMFFEKNLIRTEVFLQGYFDFRLHFLYIRQFFDPVWKYGGSTWGPDDDISFFLGWPFFIALAIGGVMSTYQALRFFKNVYTKNKVQPLKEMSHLVKTVFGFISKDRSVVWFISISLISAIALFFTLYKALLIWQIVSILQNIQFPWRWLSIAVTSLALFSASIVNFIPNKWISTCCAVLLMASAWLHISYFTPEVWLDTPSDLYYDNPLKIQTHMSDIMLDYIPSTLHMNSKNVSEYNAAALAGSQQGSSPTQEPKAGLDIHDSLDPVFNTSSFSNIKGIINKPHLKLVEVTTQEPSDLVWAIADFPGWKTIVNGEHVESFTTQEGLLGVKIKPGISTVEAVFTNSPTRTLADTITIVSIVTLVSILIIKERSFKKT